MTILRIASVAALSSFILSGSAQALTLTNSDSEPRVVTVTENGKRAEVSVAANGSVTVCQNGCFISFPSGDVMAFKGAERVVIQDGKGRVSGQ